ncbi:MAG: DUF192 domain-containing protein [Gammaproteobacteria bacterium]
MQAGTLRDADDGRIVVQRVARTTNAVERLRGLLGAPPLAADAGLWLLPCNSVHTAFMRVAIDVVFVDRSLRVVRIVAALPPWRCAVSLRAHSTLELAAGRATALGLAVGSTLRWEPTA